MWRLIILGVGLVGLLSGLPIDAQAASLEHLLRSQVFSKEFEGFDSYYVTIEADDVQPDGSREVLASESGAFLDRVQRLKVLFLLVDDRMVGGQVLEKEGIPPCRSSSMANHPS